MSGKRIATGVVEDATPATEAVYEICREVEAPTQTEIVERTGLSRASVRAAAAELSAAGLLEVRPDPRDARRRRYVLTS